MVETKGVEPFTQCLQGIVAATVHAPPCFQNGSGGRHPRAEPAGGFTLEPDSSGLPAGLLDQRFERWVSLLDRTQSALQRAYHRRLRLESL